MGFQELYIKKIYKTYKDNIVTDFYIPVLEESKVYKRAVGFFTSSALIELTKGITGLIKNGGSIQLIVSPRLTAQDVLYIQEGYRLKDVIQSSLVKDFIEPKTQAELERISWIGYLIATDRLEIKVAFTKDISSTGMYHEKVGVMVDSQGNRIAFQGSMNETTNAFHNNVESITVFNSWNDIENEYTQEIESSFDSLWNDNEKNLHVIDFPQVLYDKLKSYSKDEQELNLDLDFQEYVELQPPLNVDVPTMPKDIQLFDYQTQAIDEWQKRNFRGIFDMATGTGKTLTGLGAVVRLFQMKKRFFLLIVCPYQHLVEQWVEDIEKFNIKPIVGYSSSQQKDWKKRLKDNVNYFNAQIIDFKCFVTTNRSFISQDVRNILKYLKDEVLLLVDEAHNFGSRRLQETLNSSYKYRLGLSATLERHNDTAGTQTLFDYFGEKCIEYDIERAIKEEKLTRYYYHPVVVYLTNFELSEYNKLSKKIAKAVIRDKYGKIEITEHAKTLMIMRSRIVAGAFNKVETLKNIMFEKGYINDTHMLIYCGSATIDDGSTADDDGQKQIMAVCKMLGNDLGMKVTKFTSEENAKERESIKRGFIDAEPYQAIVAIKCLDEGVNIPSIKTAFILASTTNPKEYIQRRGRVLRKSPNKEYSVIWDFVTLPRELSTVNADSEEVKYDVSLVKKEIARMEEFGRIAENPSEMDRLKSQLVETYGLDRFKISEEDLL